MAIQFYYLISDTPAVNERGERARERVYFAQCEAGDVADTAIAGIPIARFSAHPTDLGCIAKSAKAAEVPGGRGSYLVTYSYDSAPFAAGTSAANTANAIAGTEQAAPDLPADTVTPADSSNERPPDERPPLVITGSPVKTTRILTHGFNTATGLWDIPVLTAAGQPFDPPLEVPMTNRLLHLTCYRDRTFDAPGKADEFEDTVNDAQYLGYAAGRLRCNSYRWETVWESGGGAAGDGGDWYWKLDLELEENRFGWNSIKVLNAGTVQAVAGKPPQPILDQVGNPIAAPIPLSALGVPLNTGAAPVYLEFKGYRPKSWQWLIDTDPTP